MMNSTLCGLLLIAAGVALLSSRRWATGIAGVLIALAGAAMISYEAVFILAAVLLPPLVVVVFLLCTLSNKTNPDRQSETHPERDL